MEFWLQDGRNSIQLPVKPSEYNIAVSQRNTVVNVVQIGDINLLGNSGLREISLSSFFPANQYNFSNTVSSNPLEYVKLIEGWRESNAPIRVIITGTLNMTCTIESFTYGERDATRDIYYTLALKEYKVPRIGVLRGAMVGVASDRVTQPSNTNSGRTYTVKKGDCLWNIAKQFYGNGAEHTKIYNANKDKISNPDKIYVGQVLIIP